MVLHWPHQGCKISNDGHVLSFDNPKKLGPLDSEQKIGSRNSALTWDSHSSGSSQEEGQS